MVHRATQAHAAEIAAAYTAELVGAVIVLANDGTILAWNAGATSLFGYEEADALQRSVFDLIVPPDVAASVREWLQKEQDVPAHESARIRRGGRRVWVDVAVKVHTKPDGACLFVVSQRDATRTRYQREAQILQARFRGVLEAAPDAIVLVDEYGHMTVVNSETERLFGYGRGELLGEVVELLVPSRFHGDHPSHRAKYFADPQTRPMGTGLALFGRRKDGSEFPVEISLSPLSIDDVHYAMAAIRDVTSRKRTEEALRVANSELESFTYSVSHDLRAPIRQIDGFARIIAEKIGDTGEPLLRHYLQRIQDGARHMGRLVDDLLNLSHIGRQDLHPRPVSLDDIVHSAIAGIQTEIGARVVRFVVAPLPIVECDPGLMKIAFTNLLSNALKYTRPRDEAVITIGRTARNGAGGVFIRDNGVGFDMKYADKLFGVFQRLHRADEFEGTGVGLATVQRIIHKHGGEIWADASPDGGATFSFTLGRTAPPPGS